MKFKPCPFCGGQAQLGYAHGCNAGYVDAKGFEKRTIPLYIIMCLDCRAKSYPHERAEDACKAWNRRANDV